MLYVRMDMITCLHPLQDNHTEVGIACFGEEPLPRSAMPRFTHHKLLNYYDPPGLRSGQQAANM
jgi:hypothetical protein